MDVEAVEERLPEFRYVGDVGQDAQLDLGVVGRQDPMAVGGDEGGTDAAPSSVRTGMFWRFGSLEERRPVVVAASEKVVWIRSVPRSAATSSASA